MPKTDTNLCSAAELATLLGLTPRRVRQMGREGTLPRRADGRYPTGEAVRAYVALVREAPDAAEWKQRRERARALITEHALAKLAAQFADPMGLWPRVLLVMEGHVSRVRQLTNTLPPLLVNLRDPYAAHTILEDRLFPALRDLADELEEQTPEPHRARFREAREREAAEFAAIAAAEAERAARREANREALDRAVARTGKV